MDVSCIDGFLTALICGPRLVLPSEWLPWVWDIDNAVDTPQFESIEQAAHISKLLMRLHNDISFSLSQAPDMYEPLLTYNANPDSQDPIPVLDEWCLGFIKGANLYPEDWEEFFAKERALLSTIFLYGTETGWEGLKRLDLSIDEHIARADDLTDVVRAIYLRFSKKRDAYRMDNIGNKTSSGLLH